MPIFDLSAVTVQPTTPRTYRIPALGVELSVVTMTEANEAFFADMLERATRAAAAGGTPEISTIETRAATRKSNAAIFAKYALVGWSGVKTSDGAACDFTAENATAWCVALAREAPHLFDAVYEFARTPDNWTRGAIDAAARALAGNSNGG
jgi:hypothetical protein